uniref:phage major capsid protein n=1 Tax=Ningiella ruwaisensis TaxID=2364274 RepID=UPI0010A01063|nr:phage major capsid protein [Ningiella ruwaisensis]
MAVELKDIEEVAKDLGAKFNEFKSANDKQLEAIDQEKSKLSEKVDGLNEKLSEMEQIKKQLETLQKQQNRPGITDDAKNEYKEGFLKFMRKGDASKIETKAVNLGDDAEGGFAVPEELDRAILELERDVSPMRQVCNAITVSGSNYRKLVNLGGAASGWVGEEAARPETDAPTLAQLTASMGEIYANPAATQQSLDDIFFNAEAWISSEVATEFAEQEGEAFLTGNGTNKPKGILAHTLSASPDATRTFGQIQRITAAGTTAVTGDELITLIHSMKKAYRMGASFMMNSLTVSAIRKLKDSEGNYLWRPGLEAGAPSALLGYSIVENEDVPDLAANANGILFGNFNRAYTIVDRIGTRMLRDPYTNKPFVHFYTTRRTGGMLTDSNAVKVLRQAAS